jgi:hypothetical protein
VAEGETTQQQTMGDDDNGGKKQQVWCRPGWDKYLKYLTFYELLLLTDYNVYLRQFALNER